MKLTITLLYLLALPLTIGGGYFNQHFFAGTREPAVKRGHHDKERPASSLLLEIEATAAGEDPSAQAKQTLPGKMVFDNPDPKNKYTIYAGDKGKVDFDHEQHAKKDTCVTCHHTNSEKLTRAIEQPVMKCTTCHKAKEEVNQLEGSREGVPFKGRSASSSKDAFHGDKSLVGCIGCHKAREQEPSGCTTCHLKAAVAPLLQEEQEDSTRRLWNKQFAEARAKTKKPADAVKVPTKGDTAPTPGKTEMNSEAAAATPPPGAIDGELVGVTLWRLRSSTAGDDQNKPRILVQKEQGASQQLLAERVEAETPFKQGELVRLSIEVPRETEGYLYVIDREVYAGHKTSDPYLIFPGQSTPAGGNVVTAGKIIYVPAQGDHIPYFTLQRSRADQVSESLTIIISPQPLPLGVGLRKLDPGQVAQLTQWEKQWGGPTERRESKGSVGKEWTNAEKKAGEGEGLLAQGDPLPQTIYRVAVKPGGPVLVMMPLRIAP